PPLYIIDATDRVVLPSFCDSHTHLVYAGSREGEFADKLKGLSYTQIAARGGGILNSVKLLEESSQQELYQQSVERAWEIIALGTGAVEIKSGYGLSLESELKMLRVAKMIAETTPLTVKATFLGAHAIPQRFEGRGSHYIDEIVETMLPAIAAEGLAQIVDIFVERGFFTVEDGEKLFNAALRYGFKLKVHANQMSRSKGVELAAKYRALSADHLESTGQEQFKVLKEAGTIATLLPGSSFFLNMGYAPAKEMLSYGLPLALASNYNPGSSPTGDMKFIMALATLKMGLPVEVALNGATINGAFAMDLGATHGSIAVGKRANLIVTKKIPSYQFIPYAFTTPFVESVILNGLPIEIDSYNRVKK
ncbi:MAG: imidazolonepropionase, partial [Bacteroidales bacterium]